MYTGEHAVSIEIVWRDVHMLELEIRVDTGEWAGRASAYASHDEPAQFAERVGEFVQLRAHEAHLALEVDKVAITILRYDAVGHVGVCSKLSQTVHEPGLNRAPFELFAIARSEMAQVDRFWRELQELARAQAGKAVLVLE